MKYGDKDYEAMMNRPFTEETKCFFAGGRFNGMTLTVAECRKRGMVGGTAPDWSKERKVSRMCPYPIFDNAPKFAGYLGPFAGEADAPLRYETSEVYNALSI